MKATITLELELHDYERLTEALEYAIQAATKAIDIKEQKDFYNLYKNIKLYEHSTYPGKQLSSLLNQARQNTLLQNSLEK